jgi:hypothetical protein
VDRPRHVTGRAAAQPRGGDRIIDAVVCVLLGLALLGGKQTSAAPWWDALRNAGALPFAMGAALLSGGVALLAAAAAPRRWLGRARYPLVAVVSILVAACALVMAGSVISWAVVHGLEGSITAILVGSITVRLLVAAGRVIP